MRINNTGNNPISNPAQDPRTAETSRTYDSGRGERTRRGERSEVAANDSVKPNISARAREFAKAKHLAAQSPDVREEKIAELKRRIAEGRYSVDGEKIADKMVNDHMQMGIG